MQIFSSESVSIQVSVVKNLAHHTDVASIEGVASSNVLVVNWKMPRLFFAGRIGETNSMVTYLMKDKEKKFRKGL